MKKIIFFFLTLALIFSSFNFAKAQSLSDNLIANPSVQTADSTGKMPLSWQTGQWGTNTATFTYKSNVTTGGKSLYLKMSSFTSGDAKWFFNPVQVLPSTEYFFSDNYKSNVSTDVVALLLDAQGKESYQYLGTSSASTAFKTSGFIFSTPSNTVKMSVFHLINRVGTLETDNFVLKQNITTTTLDSIPNGSLELSSYTNSKMPKDWQTGQWGQNTAAFSYLKTGHTGTKSLKVTISNYINGDAKWYYTPQPVTAGGSFEFKDYYKSTGPSQVLLVSNNNDGSTNYTELATLPATGSWTLIDKKFVMPSNTKTASVMHILTGNGSLTTDDYTLNTYVPKKFQRGLVSLTFDDAWASQYTDALPIMTKYGFKSTDYILTGSLGTNEYMTLTQVKAMASAGNEIGSHTVNHPFLNQLTLKQLTNELVNAKNYLNKNIGPVSNFAAPYGEANTKVITEVKKYYSSNRSVEEGYNTPDDLDLYNIKVQNILVDTTLTQVQSWVDYAKQNNVWLVLVYHQVDNSGGTYSISPTSFDNQMSYIKQAGLTVLTLNQALSEVLPQIK